MQGKKRKVSRKEIARAARMYKINTQAYRALRMSPERFVKLCRQFNIESPTERNQRRKDRRRYFV